MVEIEQVRKIGAPRLPKRAPPIQDPHKLVCPLPKFFAPLKYIAGGNWASEKNRGPSAPKGGPIDSGTLADWFARHSNTRIYLPPSPLLFRFIQHNSEKNVAMSAVLPFLYSVTVRDYEDRKEQFINKTGTLDIFCTESSQTFLNNFFLVRI